MRTRVVCCLVGVLLALGGSVATADQVSDILSQATLPEFQSYLRVLTGVDPLPGSPPTYLTNRYSYSQNARKAGSWLKNQFTSWGYSVTDPTFNSSYSPNVVAERAGAARPQDIYIICAHYDGASEGPGCDDNGSGTAAVMMAARVLSRYAFQATVRFVAFSGEEQWMVGSEAYAAAAHGAGENIAGVINLDMLLHPGFDNHPANADYDLDIESNTASLGLAQYLAGQIATYTSVAVQVHNDPNSASDHVSFWPFGYSSVGLAENKPDEIWGGSNSTYHTANDVMTCPDFDWPFGLEATRGSMAGLIGLAGLVPEPGSAFGLLLLAVLLRRRGRRPRC
jgi:Zn-dependent M28 family amino/carboxypeptidase